MTKDENHRFHLADIEPLMKKALGTTKVGMLSTPLSRAFNKKVRSRSFQQVLVVRRPIIISYITGSKFTSKWDDPYMIWEVYTNDACRIVDTDIVRVGLINGKFLKLYYP